MIIIAIPWDRDCRCVLQW